MSLQKAIDYVTPAFRAFLKDNPLAADELNAGGENKKSDLEDLKAKVYGLPEFTEKKELV
jgi:hypothetical protein